MRLQRDWPESAPQKQFLAELELQDYLRGSGQWAPSHHKEFENEEEKCVPDHPINNYKLGNLIRCFIEQLFEAEIA